MNLKVVGSNPTTYPIKILKIITILYIKPALKVQKKIVAKTFNLKTNCDFLYIKNSINNNNQIFLKFRGKNNNRYALSIFSKYGLHIAFNIRTRLINKNLMSTPSTIFNTTVDYLVKILKIFFRSNINFKLNVIFFNINNIIKKNFKFTFSSLNNLMGVMKKKHKYYFILTKWSLNSKGFKKIKTIKKSRKKILIKKYFKSI